MARLESGSGAFEIVVAASPGGTLDFRPELLLVKAALLYGDRVRLISPASTAWLRVRALPTVDEDARLDLLERLAPDLMPDAPSFAEGVKQLRAMMRKRHRTPLELNAIRRLNAGMREPWAAVSSVVDEIMREAHAEELEVAVERGLVEVEDFDPGDKLDFLVACVRSAARRDVGRPADDPVTDAFLNRFVDKVGDVLVTGLDYPLFDESVNSLADAAVREGVFAPSLGVKSRGRQTTAAAGFLERLPTFPGATLEEVIDIRSELDRPLIRFRSEVLALTQTFQRDAYDPEFRDEVQDAWVGAVRPAIEEIDELIEQNSTLRRLAERVIRRPDGIPALASIAVAASGRVPMPELMALTVGATLSLPILRAALDIAQADRDAQQKPFYFLHRTEQLLS